MTKFNRFDIIKYCIKNIIDSNKRTYKNYIKGHYPNVYNFIMTRYDDSELFAESFYRFFNNIYIKPKCICGNNLKFKNINKGYYEHCCNSCAQKDEKTKQKIQQSCIKTYGSLQEYHRQRYEKVKKTNLERYGYEYSLQRPDIQEKIKKTTIDKYGIPYYNNKEKAKDTCMKKYGVKSFLVTSECKEKFKEKYGVYSYFSLPDAIENNIKYHIEHRNKLNEARKQTCLRKYNVDNVSRIPKVRKTISQKISSLEVQHKIHSTKEKNHSFNKSSKEDESYEMLRKKWQDTKRQYKSEKYPFDCDFYIPSLDLYIECNYHWTHGGKPYEETEEDLAKVEKWKNKNTKYYDNAISTWTIRDVNKRKIAKENKLNWIEFFSILELNEWLK